MISLAFIKTAINSGMMWADKTCSHTSTAIVWGSPREVLVWLQAGNAGRDQSCSALCRGCKNQTPLMGSALWREEGSKAWRDKVGFWLILQAGRRRSEGYGGCLGKAWIQSSFPTKWQKAPLQAWVNSAFLLTHHGVTAWFLKPVLVSHYKTEIRILT